MNISKNSKEKKLYSSKILYKAPNIYETYKRMKQNKNISFSELNTSRSSIDGINKQIDYNLTTKNNEKNFNFNNQINLTDRNIQNNKKTKNVQNKPHLSYLGFLESKGFAFVSNEPRFKWQNTNNYNYPTGINTFQRTKKHFKMNYDDYSKMEYEYKRQKKYVHSPSNDYSLNLTKRVLNTDENNKNDEELFVKKIKKKKNVKKFLNVGGIMSLLKKTPLKQEFKGVKRIKRNNSYDLNLFGKDYAKYELPKTNKKHFKDKNVDNDIFGLHKFKSFDNIKYKESKSFKKYKKYIEINPINWNIINYKNFYGKK